MEIAGLEFDWLASDADGHVALFSTAGGGYVPEKVLQDTDAHLAAIEAILDAAASTEARLAPELAPALTNTWRLVAERGLFAFDSDLSGGPYHLVSAPKEPVRLAQLPGSVRVLASLPFFPHLKFTERTEISKERLGP
jgi:hypothetical protein